MIPLIFLFSMLLGYYVWSPLLLIAGIILLADRPPQKRPYP
jgi:hypothetical protein